MGLLQNLWAEIKKVLDFATIWAPVAAIADPAAAAGIANATAAIGALQPVIKQVSDLQAGAPITHEQMVDAVSKVVASSSDILNKAGVVSASSNDHVQALVPVIHAAVIASGLASTPPASPPPPIVP